MDNPDQPHRAPPPIIGISCCRRTADGFPFHSVGEKYATAITDAAGAIPVLVPALASHFDVDALLARLDAVLLTGSPSNVQPHHYGGGPEPADNKTDPERDATTLALIRRAIAHRVPLLGLCRGIQELNVALGGSLHQELHKVDGRLDHRSDKSKPLPDRYGPRHEVRLAPGGILAQLAEAEAIQVNSLHGQAIDRLADGLVVEATAPDGTVEAVRVADADAFALAVQWHPEFRPLEDRVSHGLFRAFGAAALARAARRQMTDVL